jgi:hypothetical protein
MCDLLAEPGKEVADHDVDAGCQRPCAAEPYPAVKLAGHQLSLR